VAATLKNLASLLHARGDWAAAEPLYQRALEIVSSVHGPNSQEAAQVMNNLGMLMERQRNFKVTRAILEALQRRRTTSAIDSILCFIITRRPIIL
jgi:tetratricopeptide (TPR) repeat protein